MRLKLTDPRRQVTAGLAWSEGCILCADDEVLIVVTSDTVVKRVRMAINFCNTERGHYCVVKRTSILGAWNGNGSVVEYEHRMV